MCPVALHWGPGPPASAVPQLLYLKAAVAEWPFFEPLCESPDRLTRQEPYPENGQDGEKGEGGNAKQPPHTQSLTAALHLCKSKPDGDIPRGLFTENSRPLTMVKACRKGPV